MAPIRMKTKTSGPISPGTSSTGKSRDVRAISKELDKAIQRRESLNKTREDYFGGRKDITDDRLEKRQKQADLVNQFKKDFLNPIKGVTQGPEGFGRFTRNLEASAPMSFEKFRQETANKYGPTNREVMGDIGFGLGNIAQGFGDFAARGGTIGNVLSDLFSRVKGGTQQGIESVKGLYDNLRKNILREPTVTTGGGSTIYTTTEDPFQDLTREKIQTQAIDPLIPPRQIGDESDPSIFGLDAQPNDPFRNQQVFEPIQVSDMDMRGVMASNMGQNVIGNLQNLQNLANKYNLNKIQFDPFNPNRIGYSDQFMFNQTPVNYNLSATPQGMQGGLNFTFKDGGSVDKYAGLGYKFK